MEPSQTRAHPCSCPWRWFCWAPQTSTKRRFCQGESPSLVWSSSHSSLGFWVGERGDPLLPGQKEVGRGTELCWGWGPLAAPGDLVSRPEEFPTEVDGKTRFCFGFWKGLAIFFQCWFNKTQNCFSRRFPLHFLSHSICAKKGTTCAFDSFTLKSSLLPGEIPCLRNLWRHLSPYTPS